MPTDGWMWQGKKAAWGCPIVRTPRVWVECEICLGNRLTWGPVVFLISSPFCLSVST